MNAAPRGTASILCAFWSLLLAASAGCGDPGHASYELPLTSPARVEPTDPVQRILVELVASEAAATGRRLVYAELVFADGAREQVRLNDDWRYPVAGQDGSSLRTVVQAASCELEVSFDASAPLGGYGEGIGDPTDVLNRATDGCPLEDLDLARLYGARCFRSVLENRSAVDLVDLTKLWVPFGHTVVGARHYGDSPVSVFPDETGSARASARSLNYGTVAAGERVTAPPQVQPYVTWGPNAALLTAYFADIDPADCLAAGGEPDAGLP